MRQVALDYLEQMRKKLFGLPALMQAADVVRKREEHVDIAEKIVKIRKKELKHRIISAWLYGKNNPKIEKKTLETRACKDGKRRGRLKMFLVQ